MTTKLFKELGLSQESLKAIDKLGFEQASPIQAEAIPVLLAGHDVVGQSQTGSGKTAAFALPAIEKVDASQRVVQVMILCPTRELAVQVSEEVHKLAFFKRGIHALPVYGGQSYERQFIGLKQGAQIVIGTPGRVMDHMRRGTLRLDKIRMVVLDEADVMLDMGFREDIEFILQGMPPERQTVFFSATMPRPIQELIKRYARDPQNVRIEQKALTVPTVEQSYYEVDRRFKIDLLARLIDIHDLKLGIIFCNTKRMVDELVDHLNAQGYSADRLHGDMSQAMRDRVMQKFRKSGLEFLVATDVAARGIDVEDVQVVFNYDLPYDPEDYLHRIGRTGRAGRSGRAISFVSGREIFQIQHIERFTRTKIHRLRVPTPSEVEEARSNSLLDKIRVTLAGGEFKRQDSLIERLLEEGFSSTDLASALMHHLQGGDTNAGARPARMEKPTPKPDPTPHETRAISPAKGEAQVAPQPQSRSLPPSPSGPKETRASGARYGVLERPRAKLPSPAFPTRNLPPWKVTGTKRPSIESTPSTGAADLLGAPSPQGALRKNPLLTPSSPRPSTTPQEDAKPSRRTPDGFTRIYMNVGSEMGISNNDVLGAILGETGLPSKTVGAIDLRERHLFVDVVSEHTNGILGKMNRALIKKHRVKTKVA